MRKQHKKYRRPKKPFESKRIEEENILLKQYGLKNKRELWRASSLIEKIRNQAKKLLTASSAEQKKFLDKLIEIGLIKAGSAIDDVLSLKNVDILERRLQTIVFKKGIARSVKQARQFIIHKHVVVGGRVINIPSYIVPLDMENSIKLKIAKRLEDIKKPKEKAKEKEKGEEEKEKEEKGEEEQRLKIENGSTRN